MSFSIGFQAMDTHWEEYVVEISPVCVGDVNREGQDVAAVQISGTRGR